MAVSGEANGKSGLVIDDFEDGLDGWHTDGGNSLRVIEPSGPTSGVTHGSNVLEVTVNRDAFPNIVTNRVKQVDLVNNPSLLADVTPQLDQSVESSLTFQLRLHHSHRRANETGKKGRKHGKAKRSSGGTPNENSVMVVESPEIVASPGFTERLSWDLSDVDEAIRRKAKRLQIRWYPTRYPPERGAKGKQKKVDYSGTVHVDWVRTTESVNEVAEVRYQRQWQSLKAEHGPYRDTRILEQTDSTEHGEFVFDDGTAVYYSVEVLADDKFELTIASETFKLGDGWI
ncbi:hypothetical protein [Haloarcula amylolytica]|uniref:Uncharacterized protein n=1 Tax=Haloarcula amylolytica JCM 13557 TaxID=1227452 RepID=M0K0B4_9EURY|nr:hypothetical protein [Haloarcula amylolytica]EMA14213.1 hypothetical protein C442_20366 [Haloarcula amylolytica JCM 13557]